MAVFPPICIWEILVSAQTLHEKQAQGHNAHIPLYFRPEVLHLRIDFFRLGRRFSAARDQRQPYGGQQEQQNINPGSHVPALIRTYPCPFRCFSWISAFDFLRSVPSFCDLLPSDITLHSFADHIKIVFIIPQYGFCINAFTARKFAFADTVVFLVLACVLQYNFPKEP